MRSDLSANLPGSDSARCGGIVGCHDVLTADVALRAGVHFPADMWSGGVLCFGKASVAVDRQRWETLCSLSSAEPAPCFGPPVQHPRVVLLAWAASWVEQAM